MEQTVSKVTLTQKEAEEYCAYKRQKKISEIMAAMRRTESELSVNDSAVKLCEQAARLRQAAVKMRPSDLIARGEIFLKSGIKIDCIVGGNGETFAAVKAYEAKKILRAGAKELTLILTPSLIVNCRYTAIRKEIKKVRRAVKRATLKVRVEKCYPQATMERLARICAELGVQYFSVPYFTCCERLKTECSNGCLLEVSGIDSLAVFKEMAGAGIGRMLVNRAWELYSEWLKEAERITVAKESVAPLPLYPILPPQKEVKTSTGKELSMQSSVIAGAVSSAATAKSTAETGGVSSGTEKDSTPIQATSPMSTAQTKPCNRLEGSDLKFI